MKDTKDMDSRTYITTDEVARLCQTSPSTVRYWRHTGYGPKGFKVGRRVLYAECVVRDWLEHLEAEPV